MFRTRAFPLFLSRRTATNKRVQKHSLPARLNSCKSRSVKKHYSRPLRHPYRAAGAAFPLISIIQGKVYADGFIFALLIFFAPLRETNRPRFSFTQRRQERGS